MVRRLRGFTAARRDRSFRGQALAETALVMPLFVTLTLGTADGGRAFYYRESVTNATRQALRVAVTSAQQGTGNTACTGNGNNPSTLSTTLPASSTSPLYTIANAAALENSNDGTPGGTKLSGATLTVTWNCVGGVAITNSTASSTDPGDGLHDSDSVEVRITYPFSLITPLVSRLFGGTPQIGADVVGRTEY